MAFGGEPIPNVVHVDVTQGAAPSPTVMIPTSFVMTLKVMPTDDAVNNGDDPDDDDDDDDGECWKYVGIDVEPVDSDALDESSDSEEDAAPDKRSIAGRISLEGTSSLLSPGLSKRAGHELVYINKIGNCATTPNPNVIVRAEIHPGPQAVMKAFDMQATGDKHGLDPKMYCE
jgi:hypothetical protein